MLLEKKLEELEQRKRGRSVEIPPVKIGNRPMQSLLVRDFTGTFFKVAYDIKETLKILTGLKKVTQNSIFMFIL